MKKVALGVIVALFMTMCDIPAFSESALDEYAVYREYRDNIYRLQQDVAHLYLELHREKNTQAVYEHVLQVIEKTAALTGEAALASKDINDDLRASLQNYMEILLILGLNEEQISNLMDMGYTEEDIAGFMDWILLYNDYNHHVVTGFTPEEMELFYAVGLTDEQITDLQTFIHDHYAQLHTAQNVVKQQQTELMQVHVSLSLVALKLLENENQNKEKGKDTERLNQAEEKLLQAILNVSEDHSSLEKVKAYSKQVYTAAEQNIRNGETQYFVDFFVGLQIHCGAVTALHGDVTFGLAHINHYKGVVAECLSPERPVPQFTQTAKQQATLEQPILGTDFVGQIKESNEVNNMGVITVLVKAPDTTFLQFLMLLFACVGAEVWANWTLPDLVATLESLFASSSVTVSSIVTGAVGAVILLLITIPPVGLGEWPDAVVGFREGEEIIIIVDGSYGQGHIQDRAKSDDECVRSGHEAITNDPYKIKKIVEKAEKLLYNIYTGRHLYYFTNWTGEWVVVIEELGDHGIFQLVTSFRADCPLSEECMTPAGKIIPVNSYLDELECQGYVPISMS